DFLGANDIPSTPGRARYTHLLRDDGTILDDVIVTCLAPDRFFMVCNAGPRAAVLSWLQAHAKSGVRLADRTDDFLCLALQGPRASDLLQRFTSVDLSKVKPFSGALLDFVPPAPWGAAPRAVPPEIEGWGSRTATDPSTPPRREPSVSDGRTAFLATRTGYTGEAGFELFPTSGEGPAAWEALLRSGGKEAGQVPSGTMSPSLRVGIALASVDKSASAVGTPLDVDIRGTSHPAHVVKLPFL